ncbi:hypothetical protein SAMN06296036_10861 [Pseudobacteriovorax antillogorgiicola]|uniref:Uncharacterized protein n=1 Tax=Pseudobacteriovorax antillogorgiicola TaxID=1513793 RepID=A0A1Y6BX66_9BACT|nr:hypothetical protein EDD56_108185 [Pseudobacteriovorax antillogorgiicola]SMF25329.1 hypothetical protein SAMN06296036_10861 [Pseudobacteriovorax antillogorgiicola]
MWTQLKSISQLRWNSRPYCDLLEKVNADLSTQLYSQHIFVIATQCTFAKAYLHAVNSSLCFAVFRRNLLQQNCEMRYLYYIDNEYQLSYIADPRILGKISACK